MIFLWSFIAILIGLALLFWSANKLIIGATAIATIYRLPPLLVGVLIVGFGTSLPEVAISIISAYQNNPGIAVGNAYGSNIVNIALIIGSIALFKPIKISNTITKRDLPILIIITFITTLLALDNYLSRIDCAILIIIFISLIIWNISQSIKKSSSEFDDVLTQSKSTQSMSIHFAILSFLFGLIILLASSRLLIWGAITLARHFHVSDEIIGLTIIAIGTSTPEFITSLIAFKKNQDEIAFGNIIGSNLFNTLVVIGLAGLISPLVISKEILYRDILIMSIVTILLYIFSVKVFKFNLSRIGGLILLSIFIIYNAFLLYSQL